MDRNYTDNSDDELVELSKEDPDIFEVLVVRYERRLFAYIKRISYFSTEDIEDILQEIFIKVYRNLNEFDNYFKFSTWIYRIARNTTFDAIRKKHTRPQSVRLEDDDFVKIFRSSTDLEKELKIKDELTKIKSIIESLPFKYKEVLILKFIEEKSYEEIMDIVKKPKGTIATLISRGRGMIAKEIIKAKLR